MKTTNLRVIRVPRFAFRGRRTRNPEPGTRNFNYHFTAFLMCCALAAGGAGAADAPLAALTSVQRLERERLQAVHDARARFARERLTLTNYGVYEDFRAVIHVHAEDSRHTRGSRREVFAAALKTGVKVVLFTDHNGPKPSTWHGLRQGVLFLAGAEDGEGVIRFPEFDARRRPLPTNALRFLSHVERRLDTATDGFDGMEILNRHTDQRQDLVFKTYLMLAMKNDALGKQLVAGFKAFPDECFGASESRWPDILAKWDRETQRRRFPGIAANDAHQNQVFQGVTFDPYAVSFRNLTTHLLARELTEPAVREALREGRCYVAHDWLCDPTGFAFGAANNLGFFDMGDPVTMTGTTRLMAQTPLPAKLRVIHRGAVVHETNSARLNFKAGQPGPYRLEAWLDVAGEPRPWIYSNPVYLEQPSLAALLEANLPPGNLAPNVTALRDLTYTEGPEEDANKHRLDLYVPKDRRPAPVFLFIHGGAWKSGDRALYPSVANRFAREGVLVAVMSYRLAPKHPHPAQIEDVAAAFAWLWRHVGEHGGDTNRFFVGGHSAGGHLAALLALDERHLQRHQLSPRLIKGVLCLSGVYDVNDGSRESRVFGKDEAAKVSASPIHHVRAPAPPFLVTYCQWDYPTLPFQARTFHAALRRAGIASELLYVPGQGHITEMFALSRDDDMQARAVLKFIQGGVAPAAAKK
jgi:acetyl esterase/lipase